MKIIIPIIVGAVIGYFTNWLAIKMLFRPLKERRVLGLRIPFTPGLIPKERKRIAKSIGEAVGMHLLTPEKIAQVFSSVETKENIEGFIGLKVNNLKTNDRSIRDFLTSINFEIPLEPINEKILQLFSEKIKEEKTSIRLSEFLKNHMYPEYKGKLLDKLSKNGESYLEQVRNSKALEEIFLADINNKLNELKDTDIILADLIDDSLIEKLEDSIEINKKSIMNSLRELFYRDHIQKAIASSIENLVEANLSKMITMFIESKTISEKIIEVIKKYVDSSQAEEAASFILKDSIKSLLYTELALIIERSELILEDKDLVSIYRKAINNILKDENQEKILKLVVDEINNKENLIKNKLDHILKTAIEDTLESEAFKNIFKDTVDESINKIIDMPFERLLKNLDDEVLEKIFEFTNNMVNIVFKEEVFDVINLFDISKLVEDEINSFEVEYTEKLILDIADRELRAITRLGALLGAIMGLLMPVLQGILN